MQQGNSFYIKTTSAGFLSAQKLQKDMEYHSSKQTQVTIILYQIKNIQKNLFVSGEKTAL